MKLFTKASLQLSINAIVILVLAIAMLGLGLGFTKGMFAKFGEKLEVPPPDIPATSDEQIVLPKEELEIQHGKTYTFSVNFYNDYSSDNVHPEMDCAAPLGLFRKHVDLGQYLGLGGGVYRHHGRRRTDRRHHRGRNGPGVRLVVALSPL